MAHPLYRYDYIAPLGNGKYSITKLYRDKYTNTNVAIKFIRLDKNGLIPPEIRNETNYLSSVSHDGIVGYIDSFKTDTHFCIVMEYVPGGELFNSLVKWGIFSERKVKRYMVQLFDIVDYLHGKEICHKDIKLENLLLTEDGLKIKLCDFGFAASFNSEEVSKPRGTPTYFSPEIIKKNVQYPDAIDVWCCGVLMFVMLYGIYPFEDPCEKRNMIALLRNISRGYFTFPVHPKVSKECKDLITQMLQKDPLQRPTIKDIKNHPWIVNEFRNEKNFRVIKTGLSKFPEPKEFQVRKEISV
jgi:serine/threonine protein kinase